MACSLISLWVTGVSILMHAGSLFTAHILMPLACLRPVLSSVCRGPYWVLIPPQELSNHAQIVRETWGDPPVSFVPVELKVDSACVPYHTGQTTKSEISRNDEIHKESYKASTSSHTRGVKREILMCATTLQSLVVIRCWQGVQINEEARRPCTFVCLKFLRRARTQVSLRGAHRNTPDNMESVPRDKSQRMGGVLRVSAVCERRCPRKDGAGP